MKTASDPGQSANLYTASALIEENLFDTVFLTGYVCFQKPSEKLIEKRTEEELDFRPLKTFSCTLGFDHLYKKPNMKLISTLGYSQFWDEAMPVHSEGNDYLAHGFFYSLEYRVAVPGFDVGTKIYAGYNNAEELDRLIETVDKFSLQWEFNISFNTWSFKK